MRVGLVSDVHANRIALEAVLEAMPPVDRLVCAGDVVGYNPHPADCVAAVRGRSSLLADHAVDVPTPLPTVRGNHDRTVETPERYRHNRMAHAGLELARERLSGDDRAWLANLPEGRTLYDGRFRMVHSHPERTDEYVMPGEFRLLAEHLGGEAVLVLGHTHVQHHERVDGTLVVNPGSVGQPRDGDLRAAFAVLDLDGNDASVTEHRVGYDIDRVREDVEAAGLPSRTGSRLERGE
jgi:predicted phosphodiesterase